MTKRLTIALLALAVFVVLAVLPVSAATANATRPAAGAAVFIGESGLNLSSAMGAGSLAWFPSTAQTTSTTPEKVIDVTATKASFYVNPADFSSRTGNWYCWSAGQFLGNSAVAIYVYDPSIDLKVWDLDQSKDVTGKSVPAGERLTFRIETNAYPVVNPAMRPTILQPCWPGYAFGPGDMLFNPMIMSNYTTLGYDSNGTYVGNMTKEGFVDIKVKTDQGNTLTFLYNASTTDANSRVIPLLGMYVDKSPWDWGNMSLGAGLFWQTGATDAIGQRVYPSGTYTITAEFNLNSMKDNYKNAGADYAGKTITEAKTITLVADTVKIEANKDSVVRSKPFSITVTGKPSTIYYLWIKGTSQMTGTYDDQPPLIPYFQTSVYNDSSSYTTTAAVGFLAWGISYSPQNLNSTANGIGTLYRQVPAYPYNGSQYYVAIKTSDAGTRTVEFTTSNQTKAQKYTIRVENQTPNAVWNAGEYKNDEVDVRVEKGAVTITASGDGSYYLGEEVKFSGTNTETVKTYLFITGPNLPSDGAQIQSTDPRNNAVTDGAAATFQSADVKDDNTWSWKWGTATVALDAGTYTVYAVSGPRDKGTGHLSNVAYGTVSIIIKKPFVSATVSQSTVAKGDKIFVRGTAEGKPSPGVAMWVLGKNYATRDTAAVESDASFEFEIKDSTTTTMASGQYFIVIQHPMQNDQFDIIQNGNNVRNLKLGGGTDIFTLLGAGSLQGSDAAEALVQGINDPNVDDTYTKLQFLVEEPVIRIDAIGDRHVGDKFTITAQTNLAVDDEVLFEVYSSSFKPTQKSQSGEFSGATGTVKVTKGDTGMNKLSFDVDASTFKPDEYIVSASAVIQDVTGTALFNVLEGQAPTAVPTAVATTAAPTTAVPTTAVPTTVAPTKTPTQPGFGALVALIGLGAVAFLVVRKH